MREWRSEGQSGREGGIRGRGGKEAGSLSSCIFLRRPSEFQQWILSLLTSAPYRQIKIKASQKAAAETVDKSGKSMNVVSVMLGVQGGFIPQLISCYQRVDMQAVIRHFE